MTRRYRNGLTLTELLVVGTIILVVTAMSIPVVKPMMESQLTKNGAGMVATALNRARNRAVVSGRPCGVRFEYWPGTTYDLRETHYSVVTEDGSSVYDDTYYTVPGSALVLRQVEVPPVYTGFLGVETVMYLGGECKFQDDLYIENALKKTIGGKIQIGGSGPFYLFNDNSTSLKSSEAYALPPERDTKYPFKVLLAPRTTMAMPVYLPRGTAVDLQFSGIGDTIFMDMTRGINNQPVPKNTSLTVMFAPDGAVESVGGVIPAEPVHFLIGRWEQVSAVRAEDDPETYPNYADGRNFWVTVFPQTGNVTINQVNPTADVGYNPIPGKNDYDEEVPEPRLPDGVIAISRELTR
ncbi:MAG: pilus assembly FimT family protein [Thermoguttaceae bacterium]|jgi:hypothetical protein